jgi:hypothetical protein
MLLIRAINSAFFSNITAILTAPSNFINLDSHFMAYNFYKDRQFIYLKVNPMKLKLAKKPAKNNLLAGVFIVIKCPQNY